MRTPTKSSDWRESCDAQARRGDGAREIVAHREGFRSWGDFLDQLERFLNSEDAASVEHRIEWLRRARRMWGSVEETVEAWQR